MSKHPMSWVTVAITLFVSVGLAAPVSGRVWAAPPEYIQNDNGCFRYVGSEDINGDGVDDTDNYAYVGPTCFPPADVFWQGVNGVAFEDTNANGKFELGEQTISFAYFKLTDGGNYFSCGYVGTDGTFAVPVNKDKFILMPIAPPGYRTTTPYIQAQITDARHGYSPNVMGFVRDPNARLETCDQYNPSRAGP